MGEASFSCTQSCSVRACWKAPPMVLGRVWQPGVFYDGPPGSSAG